MVVVDPQRGARVATAARLVDLAARSRPARAPDGAIDPSTLAAMRPGGRLDHIATLLARAGSFPLTLGIGPETLAAWSAEAPHPRRRSRAGCRRVRSAPRRARRTSCLPEPYVPIDGPTIEAEGLGSHLPEEYVAGSNAIERLDRPDPRSAHRVRRSGRRRDASTGSRRCWSAGSSCATPRSRRSPEPLTPAQPFTVDDAARASPRRPSRPTAASSSSSRRPGPPALRAQRVLAALAEIAYEAPSQAARRRARDADRLVARRRDRVAPAPRSRARSARASPPRSTRSSPRCRPPRRDGARAPAPARTAPAPATASRCRRASTTTRCATSPRTRRWSAPNDPSIAGRPARAAALALDGEHPRRGARVPRTTITTKLDALTSGITTTAKTLTLTARRADLPAELPEQHRARGHPRARASRQPEVDLPEGSRLPAHAADRALHAKRTSSPSRPARRERSR